MSHSLGPFFIGKNTHLRILRVFKAQLIESATHKVVEEVVGQSMVANNRGHDFHYTFKHGLQSLNQGIHLIVVQVFDGQTLIDSACNVFEAVPR